MHYADHRPADRVQDLITTETLEGVVNGRTLHQTLSELEILGVGVAGLAAQNGDLIVELVLLDIKQALTGDEENLIDQTIRQFAEDFEAASEEIVLS